MIHPQPNECPFLTISHVKSIDTSKVDTKVNLTPPTSTATIRPAAVAMTRTSYPDILRDLQDTQATM